MTSLTLELGARPAPNEADKALEAASRKPVGAKRLGHVVFLNAGSGTGYVQEDTTGVCYGFSRKFHPQFDSLRDGMAVAFFENPYNAVAQFSNIG